MAVVAVTLVAVVALVGILAAIAVPNLLTAMQRSKQKRTMADIRSLATATEAYAADNNRYPIATSVSELQDALVPTYIKVLPTKDGWENEFRYECWSESYPNDSYALASPGKDGQFEQSNARSAIGGGTKSFSSDIVYSNGQFIQYPEGIQSQ